MAPVLAPVLDRAVQRNHDRGNVWDALSRARKGLSVVWCALEQDGELLAVCVTELTVYPSGRKVCEIVYGAGDEMHRWKSLLSVIEEYALAEDCNSVEIRGRPGWGRVFPEYQEVYRVLEKEIQ
jgi:hypothetical protein